MCALLSMQGICHLMSCSSGKGLQQAFGLQVNQKRDRAQRNTRVQGVSLETLRTLTVSGRGSRRSPGKWKRSSRLALAGLSLPCTAFIVPSVPNCGLSVPTITSRYSWMAFVLDNARAYAGPLRHTMPGEWQIQSTDQSHRIDRGRACEFNQAELKRT